ncbi:MAG: flavodoxin [Deltaproteobacteria bacterium]|nr:MAG: flavodoxin [Deltaproteobacteria bacterium]
MKVLNLYFSATGNTDKVAKQIEETVRQAGHEVETVRIAKNIEPDILAFDLVFAGSGVYMWLPGKPVLESFDKLREKYANSGVIKPASPRRPGKKAVVYCTYGGFHTGVNEAISTTKFMGQLFDHLGYDIIGEWHIVAEYHGKLQHLSAGGRLGNIQGRPNAADLQEISEKVVGILQV